MAPSMTAPIDSLPVELIELIASNLPTSDLFALRFATRRLERSSLPVFGRRHFRKRGFMITSASLGVLESVSLHVDLRVYVQHVWFNPDCFTFLDPADVADAKRPAYEACMRDHRQLLDVPTLTECLGRVLPRFPNLAVVGVRRSEDYRPWGWRMVSRSVGLDCRVLGFIPSGPSLALSGPTKVFHAVMNAAADGNVRLTRLYTDAVEIDSVCDGSLSQDQLEKACASLIYLETTVIKAWLANSSEMTLPSATTNSENGRGLVRLLTAAVQLKELGLQIFPDPKQSYMVPPVSRRPRSWLSSYQYLCLQNLADNALLAHLTRVKLEKFTTSAPILTKLLFPSRRSLSSLKIREVRLLNHAEGHDGRSWEPFFRFLIDECPSLEDVLFHRLSHDLGSISFLERSSRAATAHALASRSRVERVEPEYIPFDHVTFKAYGLEQVRKCLMDMNDRHIYDGRLVTYAMDDSMWHTDTSDEDDPERTADQEEPVDLA